jgi:hypothetical protein
MRLTEPKQPIEPPNRTSIAKGLCTVAALLPSDVNTERCCLEEAGQLLSEEPPNVAAALKTLEEGYAHAFRDNYRESRPEVWLVAAAVELLR